MVAARGLGAGLALLCAGSAWANDSGSSLAVTTASAAAEVSPLAPRTEDGASGARITIGRGQDLVGAPIDIVAATRAALAARYAARGGGVIVGGRPAGMPVSAQYMTSGFGGRFHPLLGGYRNHAGVDLAAPMGSPIVATSDGVVGIAGWRGGYGLSVELEHGAGMESRYAHMSRVAVAPGQAVKRGDVIGYVGSTGLSTGPHLHYELRHNGAAIDPTPSLRRR